MGTKIYSVLHRYVCLAALVVALFLPSLSVTVNAACGELTNVSVVNATPTSATLQWTVDGTGRHDYDIRVSTQQLSTSALPSATVGTAGVVVCLNAQTLADVNYSLTGLDGGVHYYVYIRQNCEWDYDGTSSWKSCDFYTPCAATNVLPVSAGFDGATTLPSCWYASGVTPVVQSSVRFGASGNAVKLAATAADGSYLYSPVFTYDAHAYLFSAKVYGRADAHYVIGVAPASDLQMVEPIVNGTIAVTNQWDSIDAVIPAEIRQEVEQGTEYVWVIYCPSSDNASPVYFDNILIEELPTCMSPAELSVVGVSDATLTLSWLERGTATAWVVEYASATDTLTVNASTNPFTLTGLAPNTVYTVRVKAACSATDQSAWSKQIVAKTNCEAYSLPFMEDFTDLTAGVPDCWDNSQFTCSAVQNWNYYATGFEGPCLRFNAYSAADNTTGTLLSPILSNGDVTSLMITYYLKNGGNATLDIYASIDGGLTFPQHFVTAERGTANWAEYEAYFSAPANSLVVLKFVATSDYGSYRMDLDNIVIKAAPSCLKPSRLRLVTTDENTATLAWASGGDENSWELSYRLDSADVQTVIVNGSPEYVFTGLEPATSYSLSELSLRAICSDTDSSAVVNFSDIRFKTACGAKHLPFVENFDNISDGIPDCWDNSEGTTMEIYRWNYYYEGYAGHSVRFDSFSNDANRTNTLKTPTVNVGNATQVVVSFMYMNPDGGPYSAFLSHDGGLTFTDTLLNNVTDVDTWTQFEREITVAANEQLVLAFHGVSNWGYGDAYLYLDEVEIAAGGGCTRPSGITASVVSATEVSVEITDNEASHTAWEVVLVAAGTDPATGTPIELTTKTATISASLESGVTYEVYVRAVCGADDKSAFRGPATITYVDYSQISDLPLQGDGAYPWEMITEDGILKLRSTNQGVHNTTSDIVATVVVPDGAEAEVSFQYFASGELNYDYLCVYVDEANPSTTNYITDLGNNGKIGSTDGETGTYTIRLSAVGTHTIRWRFRKDGSGNAGTDCAKIWDIRMNLITSWAPKNVELRSVSANTAEITWLQCDGVLKNEVMLDSVAYETTTNSILFTDLAAATPYVVKVRSILDNDTTDWSDNLRFRTDCGAFAVPFAEGFELDGSELCWKVIGNAVEISTTTSAFDGNKALEVVNDSLAGMLISPRFDVATLADYEVALAINLAGVEYHGALKPLTIGVMTDPNDVGTYIDLGDIVIPSARNWKEYRFSLADLATADYADWAGAQYIAVSMSDSATYYFDAITVSVPADCAKPTALDVQPVGEESVVSWVSDAAAHYAEIALGDSVIFAGNVQNPFTPEGLEGNTVYKVRVRAICGSDNSEWTPWTNFKTPCTLAAMPYSENFDAFTGVPSGSYNYSMTNTVLPDCWDEEENTSVVSVATSTTYAKSGNKALFFYGSTDKVVALPSFSAGNQPTLFSLWYRTEGTSTYCGTFQIGYLANQGDPDSFVSLYEAPKVLTHTEVEVIIPAASVVTPAIKYVAGSASNYYAAIDNVLVDVAPTCPKPRGLSLDSIGENNAILSWSAGGSESAWELSYKLNNGAATTVVLNDSTYEIEGLRPATSYTLNVLSLRAICSEGDSSVVVSGSATFNTPCADVTPLPLEENFAGGINQCWTRYSLTFEDGVSTANATTTTSGWNRNTNVFADGGVKVNVYGTVCKYWLVTPNLQIVDPQTVLSFDIALTKFGNTNPITPGSQADDKFIVAVSTDGDTWTLANATVWSNEAGAEHVYDNIATTGETHVLPLGAYAGQNIRIAFYGESTETGGDNDLHLSNIFVGAPASCERPAKITVVPTSETATITISDPNGSAWEYVLDDESATPIAVADTNFVLTDLTPQTSYTIFVRRVCGAGEVSAWRSVTFSTLCGVVAVPFFEGFEDYNSTSFPDCWTKSILSGPGTTGFTVNTTTGSSYNHTGSQSLKLNDMQATTYSLAVLPQFYSETEGALTLSFWMYRVTGTSHAEEGIKVWVNNTPSLEGATALIHVPRYGGIEGDGLKVASVSTAGWYQYEVVLPISGATFIMLQGISEYGNASYLDDIRVYETPSCAYPQGISILGATATGVDVLIEDADESHNAWEVAVVAHGASVATATPVLVNTKAATVAGTFVSGSEYDVYVRTVCSEEETGTYGLPVTFRYVDYSAVTDFPVRGVGDYPWTVVNDGGINKLESTNQGVPSSTSDLEATFVVPEGSVAELSFDYYAEGEGTSTMWDYLCVYVDQANPSESNFITGIGNNGKVGTPSGMGGTYTIQQLTPGTHTVRWRFRKDGSGDAGADMGQIWNLQMNYNTFYVPTDLGVENVSANEATLTWSAGSDAVLNEVLLTSATDTILLTTAENTLTVTELVEETRYRFKVRSINADNDTTAWSSSLAFTTPAFCTKPQSINLISVSVSQVNIEILDTDTAHHAWQVAFGLEGFNPGAENAMVMDVENTLVAINPAQPLISGNSYDIYVRTVCDEDVFSAWTAVKTVKYVDVTGVSNIDLNMNEGDYPWEAIVDEEDGLTKLQSTNQGVNSSVSDLTTTFVVPANEHGTLTFNYYAEGEGTTTMYDYLCIYVDEADPSETNFIKTIGNNGRVGTPDGMGGTYSIEFATGTHTVRWRFHKDISSSSGADGAKVWNIDLHTARIVRADTIYDGTCAGSDYQGYGFDLTANQLRPGNNYFEWTKPAVSDLEADSIFTLSLFVSQPSTQEFTDTVCAHEHYTGYGFDIADVDPLRTSYQRMLTNMYGCDSTVILRLFVPQTEFEVTEHLCEGQTYLFGDTTITTSGVYVRNYQNIYGCDSTITLSIYFHATSAAIQATVCQGEVYEFGGEPISAAGTYMHTFQNAAGCDSVVTLTLNVIEPVVTYINGVFCEGTTFAGGEISPEFIGLDQPGVYRDTLQSLVTGCDSILVLTLVEEMIEHTTVNGTYSEGRPFVFNGQSYQEAGTFEVVLTSVNGCDSIITLVITAASALDNVYGLSLNVAPNPAVVGQDVQILSDIAFAADYRLMVFDAVGKLVYVTDEQTLVVPGLPTAGFYTVRVHNSGQTYQAKLLVK